MFNPGDYAYDKKNNERVQIISSSEVWGFVTYKVYNPISQTVYKLSQDALSSISTDNQNEGYLRYVAMLAKIKNETSGGILSKLSSGIIPLPHQRYALNRAISNNNIRYILADEVGLGKTIEAGLIIKELKTRGLVKRVLVVCPTGLVTQWSTEMKEKFGEKFNVILPDEYTTIRKIIDSEDVYSQFDQVISPMDSIKPLERRAGWTEERIEKHNEERIFSIINSGWDLVIIDEAHRVAGSSFDVARHKLGSLLASASPYLLLLTAMRNRGKNMWFIFLLIMMQRLVSSSTSAVRESMEKRINVLEQQSDVIAFNFIMTDTVEARVREVLEEKLSTILKELGVDKYSDVLDGEQAEINFTDAYIRSIRSPKDISYSVNTISEEVSVQAKNRVKIWEAILDDSNSLSALAGNPLNLTTWDKLREISQDYAYDTFIKLKEDTLKRFDETHRKYLYALNLRFDAAKQIGIENIRNHKLAVLEKERTEAEREYESGRTICPEFRPCLIVRMEGGYDS